MLVNVIANRRDPSQRLAFIRAETPKYGVFSAPAYFDKNSITPDVGEQEVMICGVLFHKNLDGSYDFESPPKCFFLKIPNDEIKVSFEGFCIIDQTCSVLSSAVNVRNRKDTYNVITPGRLQSYLHVIDLASDHFDGRPETPLKPGIGWIAKNPETGKYRLEGVESVAELDI